MPRIFTRYRPAGTDPDGLVLPGSGFNGGSLPADFDDGTMQSDIGPSYQSRNDSAPPDMAYGDSTGPAAALDNPPPVEPSMTKKSMRPAGKVPAIAAGPPPSAQASDPNGPPIPPEGLEGAPKPPTEAQQMLQETLRRYKSGQESAPVAPGPASGIMGKIADVLVGMSRATPEEKMAMRHPIYAAQLQKYQSGMNNLLNGIKTYGTIAEEESKEQERQDNALTRRQGQQDRGQKIKDQARLTQQGQNEKLMTMAKDGATRVPSDTALTPEEQANGVMLMPDVFSDPKFSTRLETHHGMIPVNDPDLAKRMKVPLGLPVPAERYLQNVATFDTNDNRPDKVPLGDKKDQDILQQEADKLGIPVEKMTAAQKTTARLNYDKQLGQNRVQIFNQEHPQGPTNAALANVPPHLIAPASAQFAKAGQEYAQAVQAGDDMKTFIDLARSGNKLAYAYSPTEGVLTLNTGRGVKRVNLPEIESYGGAGSLADKVRGYFGKQLTGASISPEVLNDMEALHKQVTGNAAGAYANKVQIVNDSYGSTFKPSTFAQRQPEAGGGKIKVQIPGYPPGEIDASQKDAFMKKHPGATVVK